VGEGWSGEEKGKEVENKEERKNKGWRGKKRGDDIRRREMGNRLRIEGDEEVRRQRRAQHDL